MEVPEWAVVVVHGSDGVVGVAVASGRGGG